MRFDRKIDRRKFIVTTLAAGGGLALGFYLPAGEVEATAIGRKPWESLVGGDDVEVNAWLVIGADDTVTIRVAQSEMGQGTMTSWAMMIAEELQCDWTKVRTEYASANRHFRENNVYRRMETYSSSSVRLSREYLQQAGASARERLLAAAAEEWRVPASELTAKDSVITHGPTGRKLRFGQVAQKAASIRLAQEPKTKMPNRYTFLGKPTKLLETPLRVDGSATYGIDVRLPGMVYAAVKASPVFGGRVKSYNFNAIQDRPGVLSAVEFGAEIENADEKWFGGSPIENGIAVIADSYWRAQSALDLMPIEWDEGQHGRASSTGFLETALAALGRGGTEVIKKGNAMAAMKSAARVVEAVYHLPYLDHAVMEPLNCTAHVTADRVDVWAGTQCPDTALLEVSRQTGLSTEKIFIHNCFLGGGFGRRIYRDEIRQAVAIAKQVGQPVKAVWSREETMRHGRYRAMRVAKFQVGLGPDGLPLAYFNRIVGVDEANEQVIRGLHEVPYAVPNQLVECHLVHTHVPTGAWTSVGRSQNEFFLESFVDEVAHAACADPYQYRRTLLESNPEFKQGKRWVQTLDEVAKKSGWGKRLSSGTGQGIAIGDSRRPSRQEIGICAVVATVWLSKRGELRVERLDVAFDTGPFLINPLTVERQIEMQMVMALNAVLYQEITIEKGRVVQNNFDDYPLMHIHEMPEVAIHFIRTSEEPIVGVGEEALGMVAPAVCNAIFAAAGKRIRSLPLKNHDLSWT